MTNQQQYFDHLTESTGDVWWGNRTFAGKRRSQRRAGLVVAALEALPDPMVLEIGCGTGFFSRMILEARPALRLIGADLSPKSVAKAAQRCASFKNSSFRVIDATVLPFADNTFDGIVGNSILHHVDLEKTLRECVRTLKPNGFLLFSEPNMMNPQIALERHIRFIGRWLQTSPEETAFFRWRLKAALTRSGLTDVTVEPFDFVHPLVPSWLTFAMERFSSFLEKIPLVRETAGSLIVRARKPALPKEETRC